MINIQKVFAKKESNISIILEIFLKRLLNNFQKDNIS